MFILPYFLSGDQFITKLFLQFVPLKFHFSIIFNCFKGKKKNYELVVRSIICFKRISNLVSFHLIILGNYSCARFWFFFQHLSLIPKVFSMIFLLIDRSSFYDCTNDSIWNYKFDQRNHQPFPYRVIASIWDWKFCPFVGFVMMQWCLRGHHVSSEFDICPLFSSHAAHVAPPLTYA